jgi:hypothetical protein
LISGLGFVVATGVGVVAVADDARADDGAMTAGGSCDATTLLTGGDVFSADSDTSGTDDDDDDDDDDEADDDSNEKKFAKQPSTCAIRRAYSSPPPAGLPGPPLSEAAVVWAVEAADAVVALLVLDEAKAVGLADEDGNGDANGDGMVAVTSVNGRRSGAIIAVAAGNGEDDREIASALLSAAGGESTVLLSPLLPLLVFSFSFTSFSLSTFRVTTAAMSFRMSLVAAVWSPAAEFVEVVLAVSLPCEPATSCCDWWRCW